MKKCSYCGKEYPDDATVCERDALPLVDFTREAKTLTSSKASSKPHPQIPTSTKFAAGVWVAVYVCLIVLKAAGWPITLVHFLIAAFLGVFWVSAAFKKPSKPTEATSATSSSAPVSSLVALEFDCPHCAKHLVFGEAMPGMRVKCPECQHVYTAPKAP